jgi:glycolate oxidase iron-sulfur subunit
VLDRIGISLLEVPGAGCCGALRFHLNEQDAGRDDMRALIDAWWPLAAGKDVEAIVMTASGCGVTVKEYGHHLALDAQYRGKADRISALTLDLSEVIAPEALPEGKNRGRVAFHSPCSLQHGQAITGKVEALLRRVGYELVPVRDAHLCCGSAGTYSLLHPEIAGELRTRKLATLQADGPDVMATANIGCLTHLQGSSRVPMRHWIELVDAALA